MNKMRESLAKIRKYCQDSTRKGTMMGYILNSLFKRKTNSYLKVGLSVLQTQRLSSLLDENKILNDKKSTMKDRSANIMGLIFSKLQSKNVKTTFETLKHKSVTLKLLNNYRGTFCFNSIKRISDRKMRDAV